MTVAAATPVQVTAAYTKALLVIQELQYNYAGLNVKMNDAGYVVELDALIAAAIVALEVLESATA